MDRKQIDFIIISTIYLSLKFLVAKLAVQDLTCRSKATYVFKMNHLLCASQRDSQTYLVDGRIFTCFYAELLSVCHLTTAKWTIESLCSVLGQ